MTADTNLPALIAELRRLRAAVVAARREPPPRDYDPVADVKLKNAKVWLQAAAVNAIEPLCSAIERLTAERDDERKHSNGLSLEFSAAMQKANGEILGLRDSRSDLDCRFAGRYADMSGSHCPLSRPCMRCALERERDALRAKLDRLVAAVETCNWTRIDAAIADARSES